MLDADDWVVRVVLVVLGAFFLIALVVPLFMMVSRSVQNIRGEFVGLANYILYFQTPALFQSINNSFFVAGLSTAIVIVLAFGYAYALTRTHMRFKAFFRIMAFVPLLSPSLLKAIALVYWFGNQGVFKEVLMGNSIYGPIGIVIASVTWTFPHAFLIISTALSLSDARLYEAAEALKTSRLRVFFTVTLPGARYGLISATFVVFILVFTDFGVPKVIGGNYNVLATDIYKEVVGQQNFEMGAVVCMILLIPAVFAFAIDRIVTRKQVALLSARAVPYEPKSNRLTDTTMLIYCAIITVFILAILGMAQYAALVKLWPYNLGLTLEHFSFEFEGFGWGNFYNSLILAASTAIIGTALVFLGAYVVEKPRSAFAGRQVVQFLAMLPLTVPGLVLGLSYIFFFNHPANPFGFLYASMAILVMSTVTHFYTVSHLTAVTALKQMDREFESVSASLKIPLRRSFFKVTVPVCIPAILDISIYLFLNAMTTVSAVIFLYSSTTKVASVAAIHMDELGEVSSAAAMAMLIVYACLAVRLLHLLATHSLLRRLQAWRTR
ncbi:MAG: putative 2-aminoethylphosphonate ABC transporter permease subunit [Arenicellales bacterium]|jgi:iron(III) transport system permease protein|nr:putative 2-aminoethylphosphonate ABC transporter permease subunit [Arenicellales bacterium]|tara:strand:- start:749 stop:2404 length:1656 start_codon:yes stop_codon:yes gene_type:complete